MSKFAQLNCLAAFAAIAILAITIAASIVDFYYYSEEYKFSENSSNGGLNEMTINSTKIYWSLEGVTRREQPSNSVETSTYEDHDPDTSVWSIFKLLQAFILIALIVSGLLGFFLIVCFACAIRNQLLFMLGMNVLRVSMLIVAGIVLVSLIIAFLGFLGITNAFDEDIPSCSVGYCRRFQDSSKETVASATFDGRQGDLIVQRFYGPVEGWFLILACIPLAMVLTGIVVVNKFPIPVDSVTIGEAL